MHAAVQTTVGELIILDPLHRPISVFNSPSILGREPDSLQRPAVKRVASIMRNGVD
ncbi:MULTISPECIES: hypothetical protein [Gordonia]|uniref:hypothetical protein n=1 Tax=Gordonia TaxID=2053 RepID=UPI0012E72AA9|nr:hypothetical protein [Gordonia sp. 852002-51296_SCH5728562-b]